VRAAAGPAEYREPIDAERVSDRLDVWDDIGYQSSFKPVRTPVSRPIEADHRTCRLCGVMARGRGASRLPGVPCMGRHWCRAPQPGVGITLSMREKYMSRSQLASRAVDKTIMLVVLFG
jgi:hypothetical protein